MANPYIVTAERLFGEWDFYDNELGALPGVRRLMSTLVMKRIGSDRSVPIR